MTQLNNPRILLICGWYYPDSVGGTEAYVRLLGKELQALNWEVMIAAPSIDVKEHKYLYDGLPVYRYPVTFNPAKLEIRGEIPPKYLDIFANWLERNKPDIVHFHSRTRGCNVYHAKIIKRLGIPLVLTIHAADFMCVGGTALRWGEVPCDDKIDIYRCTACWLKSRGMTWWFAWLFARIPDFVMNMVSDWENRLGTGLLMRKIFIHREERSKLLFNLIDHFVAVSKWLYYVLVLNEVPESKITLCTHGLAPGLIKTKTIDNFKISEPMRIGFIGRFTHVKGLHILIKAIRELPSNIHVELKVYGRANVKEDQDYLKKVQKLSKNDKRILFCGEVTDENRQEVLNNLDILAVPSIWFETGPLVTLEAFSIGLPVIGSNLGSLPELITNGVNGLLVSIGKTKAWRNAIRWIYEHPEKLKNWMANIPPVHNVRDVAWEMHKIYERLLTK